SYSGSVSAAFGGISCVFDMPNTIPPATNLQNLNDKLDSFEKKSVVDFGLYASATNDNLEKLNNLSNKCNGFKIYLGNTTGSLLFYNKNLKGALTEIGLTGKPVLFHAEDEECLIQNKAKETNLSDHLRFRPSICEEISIRNIMQASAGLNYKIHICHVSSCEGLELLKNRPRNISFGITPHHSLLSTDKALVTPSFYKVNPPIRTSFDKELLFNSLKNGIADILESDHAPHTKEEKDVDFDEAPSGAPGVETMYPIFLYLAKKEQITFQRLISLLCNRPAEILNIPKGKIQVGYDADFIIADLKNECKIKSEKLHYKCEWTPFEDWPAIFPETVFIRGEKVIDDYEIQVKQGFGNFVGA
ncbi:MAG TPA: amidohydrolase, partial [Bacteroidetes bacterium]|nr:amidohydrolase [Bacteroidota bacterium]